MYIVSGIERKKGEFQGHPFELLTLYTLSQKKGVEGQFTDSFRFSLNRLNSETRNLLNSIKVGDKIGEIYFDKYKKPCGVIK